MPPVQGSEVPGAGRNIPPWRPGPGPPQDPVDPLRVIVPTPAAARRRVRQQRLQPDPLRISQIMTIEHRPGLPNPPAQIGETRPSTRAAVATTRIKITPQNSGLRFTPGT